MLPMLKVSRVTVEAGVGVILRVPAIFMVESWFRTDTSKLVQVQTYDIIIIARVVYYLGLALPFAMATLPLQRLVTFYMYLVSGVMLIGSFYLSTMFVEGEIHNNYAQRWAALFEDKQHIQRLFLHLAAQCFIAAIIAYLLEIRDWTKFVLLVFTLPIFARIGGFPLEDLHIVNNAAAIFTVLMIVFYIFNVLGSLIDSCRESISTVYFACQNFGYLPTLMTFWHAVKMPLQLMIFWLVMMLAQLYVYMQTEGHPIWNEGWLVVLLACTGESCATPVSLFALCVTITYLSFCVLTLTKIYLEGFQAVNRDSDWLRGWTEGFTMLLIALQTNLLELKPLQRAFLMSVLFFIVVSSLIQSMYELAEPVLLTLSASHSDNIFKHIRAVALCTVLWMFPLYMTYSICQYFDLDFWLLVIVSSCILTSVQVIGSLVVYALFMYDYLRSSPWESLDDVIYWTRSITRVLEFIVAVFLVCYGVRESLFGEWSWLNSTILIIHCYFNVWQRLQSGWKSFLLRWEAVKKVESLPLATEDQLKDHNDVCAICYQEMTTARVTSCNHYFHGLCLRKWLYVKDTCPMCHQNITPEATATVPEKPPEEASPAPAESATSPQQVVGTNTLLQPKGASISEKVEGSQVFVQDLGVNIYLQAEGNNHCQQAEETSHHQEAEPVESLQTGGAFDSQEDKPISPLQAEETDKPEALMNL